MGTGGKTSIKNLYMDLGGVTDPVSFSTSNTIVLENIFFNSTAAEFKLDIGQGGNIVVSNCMCPNGVITATTAINNCCKKLNAVNSFGNIVNGKLETSVDNKMNSPTNDGSSTSYFLRWSNANQGTWATLPTASETQAGTMSSAHYKQVNNTKRYVAIEGKNGIFNFRYWSDGFVELWAKVEISNLSVSTSLGNMYRSNSPITDRQYLYPYTFSSQPFVYTQFFSSTNASAFVWLDPTWGKATQYLPPFYLVRPTTATCSGYVCYYICGDT